MAWVDDACRYFASVRYQFFDGHHLEATLVGEHAAELEAMLDRAASHDA